MNILAKYNEFEKTLENVKTYKDLRKQIRKSFQFILKNNFTLYYFDEDNDKITISNQEDLDAIQDNQNIDLFVQKVEDDSELTDDSFQNLDKSVKEVVTYFRKLSNGHTNNDAKSPKQLLNEEKQEIEKPTEKAKEINNQQENLEKQRQKIIKEISSTIEHIRQEILKIENDDTEKRLTEKLQKLQKPQVNQVSLAKEISELQILQQIEEGENNIVNLNKVEREELKRNQNHLLKLIQNIIQNRQKQQVSIIAETKDYIKTEQKLQQQIVKAKQKNQKQLKQYNTLLNQYLKKLSQAENKKANLDKLEYMTQEQLEKYLDNQLKEELKAKKQKQLENEKMKQQIINLENDQDNQNDDDFKNSQEQD